MVRIPYGLQQAMHAALRTLTRFSVLSTLPLAAGGSNRRLPLRAIDICEQLIQGMEMFARQLYVMYSHHVEAALVVLASTSRDPCLLVVHKMLQELFSLTHSIAH